MPKKLKSISQLTPSWDPMRIVDRYIEKSRRDARVIPPWLRHSILNRDNSTCQCCGRKAPEYRIDVDHKVPPNHGGTSEPENLRAICFECNVGKSDKVLDRFSGICRWNTWGRWTLTSDYYLDLDDGNYYWIDLREIRSCGDIFAQIARIAAKASETCYGDTGSACCSLISALQDIFLNTEATKASIHFSSDIHSSILHYVQPQKL